MFNVLEKIKRDRQAKTRKKIVLISLLSSAISSVIAVFLSKKENRDKVKQKLEEGKVTAQDLGSKANSFASKKFEILKEKASETQKKLNEKMQNMKNNRNNQDTEIVIIDENSKI